MAEKFKKIGIIAKSTNPRVNDTLNNLIKLLLAKEVEVFVQKECIENVTSKESVNFMSNEELVNVCDITAVIGGDGSLLHAARVAAGNCPIFGINRGTLGFLTDICPKTLDGSVCKILSGKYISEKRFLLSAKIKRKGKVIAKEIALNDVVLFGSTLRMMEFDVFVNTEKVYTQRSDGLVIATPTGSTAYALSAGGPIMHPKLKAIVLVPLNPHTLNNRPISLSCEDKVELHLNNNKDINIKLSLDGHLDINLEKDDIVEISKHSTEVELIHPEDYAYFNTLRNKLKWV